MSTNFVNKDTGELVTLANGTRMWIGTQSAHDLAVQQGTMPNNCMVCITDDYVGDTGWVEGTNCKVRKINGIVYLSVSKIDTTSLSNQAATVAVIPEGFRPNEEISGAFLTDNQHDCPLNSRIRPNGDVWTWANQAYNTSYSSASIYGYFSYTPDN